MRLEDIVGEWADLGKQDLATARFLMTMRPIPFEIIGFLCQQAVEKYLKALKMDRSRTRPITSSSCSLVARLTVRNSMPFRISAAN